MDEVDSSLMHFEKDAGKQSILGQRGFPFHLEDFFFKNDSK